MVTEIEDRALAHEVYANTTEPIEVFNNALGNETVRNLISRLQMLNKSYEYIVDRFKIFLNSDLVSEATYIIYVAIILNLDRKRAVEFLDSITVEYPIFGAINKKLLT